MRWRGAFVAVALVGCQASAPPPDPTPPPAPAPAVPAPTASATPPPPPAAPAPFDGCEHEGKRYPVGARASIDGGCNTCRCGRGGTWGICTLAACGIKILPTAFERNKRTLGATASKRMAALAVALVEQDLRIRISGHASTDEKDPEALAQARAEAVKAALEKAGAPADRIVGLDNFGTSKPESKDPTKNRRVEFHVVK